MAVLSRVKISTRLIIGFASVIALGVLLAVLAAVQLHTLSTSLTAVSGDRIVKLGKLTEVKENLNAISRFARNMLLSNEKAFQAEQKSKIANIRVENSTVLTELNTLMVVPQDVEELRKVNELRGPYNTSIDRAIALNEGGDQASAVALLLGDVRLQQNALFKLVDDLRAKQMERAKQTAEQAATHSRQMTWVMVGLALGMLIVGGAIAWAILRGLKRSLGTEPADLCAIVNRVADGDLSEKISVQSGDSVSVVSALARMQTSLCALVSAVREGSDSVATASTQIAQGNGDLSSRTEQQASSLEETAASMEQLGSTVRHNADNALQANQLAQSASIVAVQGGQVVAQVVDTMKGINESSRKISDIISVIDGIAFQTNILALNAAVEAARAGEQGRGFAVVAAEVRSLAGRSAEAAKEIKALISSSVERVEQGSALVDRAGMTMSEVVNSIRRVTDIVAEISSASTEQSQGVGQVGEAVSQMDRATQQNAALVEQMAAAADSLKTQARDLVHVVQGFKV